MNIIPYSSSQVVQFFQFQLFQQSFTSPQSVKANARTHTHTCFTSSVHTVPISAFLLSSFGAVRRASISDHFCHYSCRRKDTIFENHLRKHSLPKLIQSSLLSKTETKLKPEKNRSYLRGSCYPATRTGLEKLLYWRRGKKKNQKCYSFIPIHSVSAARYAPHSRTQTRDLILQIIVRVVYRAEHSTVTASSFQFFCSMSTSKLLSSARQDRSKQQNTINKM